MAAISLYLLGTFEARLADGNPAIFRSKKERALLAYLATEANGHPLPREYLAELFWPDRPEGLARTSLRQSLFGVRHSLGDDEDVPLQLVGDTVEFISSPAVWVDLHEFRQHTSAAQGHLHQIKDDAEPCLECVHHLQQAVDLYRNEFLNGLLLDETPDLEEWLLGTREQMLQFELTALDRLSNLLQEMKDFRAAANYALRLVSLDPLLESAHRKVMRLLAITGQKNKALEQYEICKRIMSEELDVAPDPKTTALFEQIRNNEIKPPATRPLGFERQFASRNGREWASASAAKLAYAFIPNNLPLMMTPFVGRQDDLQRITRLLESPGCRLLTLTGIGGVGKTRLALQVAANQLGSYPDGVWFIPLADATTMNAAVTNIAQALSLAFDRARDPLTALVQALRPLHTLLVLDNFEHLLSGPEGQETPSLQLIIQILQQAPDVRLLVTSRQRLDVLAEFVFEVEGLPVAPAVELFCERAAHVSAGFRPGNTELAFIKHICTLLEGVPLAIELAAAWVRYLSCEQIARQVEQALDSLTTPVEEPSPQVDGMEFLRTILRDVPERHRSLQAAFAYSWNLLSGSDRVVYRKLAIFRGGFTAESAKEVASTSLSTLSSLVDKSLLRRTHPGRYDWHPLLQQYAMTQLAAEATELESVCRSHSLAYLEYLHRQRDQIQSGEHPLETLDQITLDYENIVMAWDWALDQREAQALTSAVITLFTYLDLRTRFEEGDRLFGKVIEKFSELSPEDRSEKRLFGMALSCQAWFQARTSHYADAERKLMKALAILKELGDLDGEVMIYCMLGMTLLWSSRYGEAYAHLQECLALAEQLQQPSALGWTSQLLGEAAYESGRLPNPEEAFRKSLAIFRQINDHRGIGRALMSLANAALARDSLAEAENYLQQALHHFEEIGEVWSAALLLSKLGDIAAARGELDKARQVHLEALDVLRKTGDQHRIGSVLIELGEISLAQHQYEESVSYFRQALQIAVQVKLRILAVEVAAGLAAVEAHTGEPVSAVEWLTVVLAHPDCEPRIHRKASKILEEVRRSMLPEDFQAAQVRAASLSLENVLAVAV